MHRTEHSSLRQGLVGAWCPSLGASGLTLIDRSGLNNHGTLTNMAGQDNWRASGSGVAISLDGVNDKVVSTTQLNLAGGKAITISLWLNWRGYSGGDGYNTIIGKDQAGGASGSYVFLIKSNGRLAVYLSNAAVAFISVDGAGQVLSTGVWYHLIATYNGSTVSTFVNGVLNSSATSAVVWSGENAIPLTIGDWNSSSPVRRLNGQLDDIRIYNRALTPAEIRLLASRRGIGLTPLPDRGAALPRRFSVNVGGDWRPADAYVNVGGVWRLGQPSVNVGGTWR